MYHWARYLFLCTTVLVRDLSMMLLVVPLQFSSCHTAVRCRLKTRRPIFLLMGKFPFAAEAPRAASRGRPDPPGAGLQSLGVHGNRVPLAGRGRQCQGTLAAASCWAARPLRTRGGSRGQEAPKGRLGAAFLAVPGPGGPSGPCRLTGSFLCTP